MSGSKCIPNAGERGLVEITHHGDDVLVSVCVVDCVMWRFRVEAQMGFTFCNKHDWDVAIHT